MNKYFNIIEICKCNITKIELFNIFDKEIYYRESSVDLPSVSKRMKKNNNYN